MNNPNKILVVDDDPRICRLVNRYLGSEGYIVHTAANSAEMQRLMDAESPDLVVLDVMLPGENGFTIARSLRANSDVPIVMLTGKTSPDARSRKVMKNRRLEESEKNSSH